MENMAMPKIMYTPGLFSLSIFIAIIASQAALWLAIKSNQGAFKKQVQLKLISSLVMGAAICGIHYTGMAAAVFIAGSQPKAAHTIPSNLLAYYIAILIGFTLFTALIILTYQQLVKEMSLREQIESARDLIELKVIDRTRELQQALDHKNNLQNTLIHAEKMATVGQLAAGIAHEINNPLSYALGNMDVFHELLADIHNKQDAALIQELNDLIDESQEGLLRIKKIVNDLISFSSSANEEEDEEDVNLNDCLESAICIIWNELKYKCTLHKKFAILPTIKGFQNQLISIFMNILLNAAQSINEKGEITITTSTQDKSIIITISDTGCGIPSEHLSQIFTPFFTTKPVGSAKGLGLATTYNMVRKHGGSLLAKSIVGKGSIFTVQLPVNN